MAKAVQPSHQNVAKDERRGLLKLPDELLLQVLRSVQLNDAKSLRLTSKQLRPPATSRLFETLAVTKVDHSIIVKLKDIADSRNLAQEVKQMSIRPKVNSARVSYHSLYVVTRLLK